MAATATLELIVKLNNKAGAGLKKFQKSIKANQKAIAATSVALLGVGAAGGLALASAAKAAANFEQGMREVNTLVNLSESMTGLQLGFCNVNDKGFLPFFPLFNYGL